MEIDDTGCKLIQVNPQTFFFATGRTSAIDDNTKRELLPLKTIAHDAFKGHRDLNWDGFVRLVADWADLVRTAYQSLLVNHREALIGDLSPRQHIAAAAFGRSFATGVRLYEVIFTYALPPEVAHPTVKWSSREVHPNAGSPIAAAGDSRAVVFVTEFLASKSPRAQAANQIFQRKFTFRSGSYYEAQKLRTAIMAAIEWIPDKKIIGGSVDILILEAGRNIEWINKKDCSIPKNR